MTVSSGSVVASCPRTVASESPSPLDCGPISSETGSFTLAVEWYDGTLVTLAMRGPAQIGLADRRTESLFTLHARTRLADRRPGSLLVLEAMEVDLNSSAPRGSSLFSVFAEGEAGAPLPSRVSTPGPREGLGSSGLADTVEGDLTSGTLFTLGARERLGENTASAGESPDSLLTVDAREAVDADRASSSSRAVSSLLGMREAEDADLDSTLPFRAFVVVDAGEGGLGVSALRMLWTRERPGEERGMPSTGGSVHSLFASNTRKRLDDGAGSCSVPEAGGSG